MKNEKYNYHDSENYIDEMNKRESKKIQLHTVMSIIIYALLILVIWCFLSGCSTEKQCQRSIKRIEKNGCLKQDSVFVYDTFFSQKLDTTIQFDTLSLIDTFRINNQVIITKWRERILQIQQNPDTIVNIRKVPQIKIVYPDCPKLKWHNDWKNIALLTSFVILFLFGFLGSLKRLKQ